ncbi:MAG: tRNA preQ1(34) S-adenosylmethionine ribosyltransferase-isomerase QueA [Gemmatimonadetes bacterium]|nr:tRNA preQ1(34) S-adenosylmethionine ribosyltransferase-isomerase QueA [Gemmatimonadota bacterium]
MEPLPGAERRTSAYDFELPTELIASTPSQRRDASRLLVVRRASQTFEHRRFGDLGDLIPRGDALIVNTSRVLRARLLGTRASGAPAEVLLVRDLGSDRWEAMVNPGNKLRPGRVVHVAPGFDLVIESITERGTRVVKLRSAGGAIADAIERHGHVPLPPYIERAARSDDAERYQTVYAREPGSVAAPTAGLHFTPDLLRDLDARGVRRLDVLLHVGPGTFKPIEVEDPAAHVMHEEWCAVSPETAAGIAATRTAGGHVWAVGTTAVRTLETMADGTGGVRAGEADTRIFIREGYRWQVVDRLITNFHLPKSTLIMLVAAFAGYDLTMEAYRVAIRERYRFYSYGDAMVIL